MKTAYLIPFPVRSIDFANAADITCHNQLVALVEQMLNLHRRLSAEHNPQVITMLQRQVEATDRQINSLVYALYDLTEDEIARVEQSTGAVTPDSASS